MIDPSSLISRDEIDISQDRWIELNLSYSKEEIIDAISDAIGTLPFPLKSVSRKDALKDFSKLANLDASSLLKNGKVTTKYPYQYLLKEEYIEISDTGGVASNFFHQENRFKCDSLNSPSPYRVWTTEKFRKNMLKNLWTLETRRVDSARLRSAMSLRNYTASQFRPSAAKAIYEYFEAVDVIDFSSGWGDRLCGFMASQNTKTYVGCDPNVALQEGYKKQIKEFGGDKQISILPVPAEEWVLEGEYDLAFTSPPYFDIERYSQDEGQSWKRYKKLDIWLEKFLFVSIENVWRHLKTGGHLAINIADVYGHHRINNICDPMNDFIATLEGASYQKGIGYKMAKRPNSKAFIKEIYAEPIFIWKKG